MKTNEAKIFLKHISVDCKCKFNRTACNSNQQWNNDKCQCECKKYRMCKKDYSWNLIKFIYKNSRHLKSIANNSLICAIKI